MLKELVLIPCFLFRNLGAHSTSVLTPRFVLSLSICFLQTPNLANKCYNLFFVVHESGWCWRDVEMYNGKLILQVLPWTFNPKSKTQNTESNHVNLANSACSDELCERTRWTSGGLQIANLHLRCMQWVFPKYEKNASKRRIPNLGLQSITNK